MSAADDSAAGSSAAGVTGPSSWVLDPAGSSATLRHQHTWGLATVTGSFSELNGTGEVLADGTGRGRLTIAAASLDTKNARRDTHLRSAAFFDVVDHPQIVADITSATRRDDGTVAVTGTLTVAGVTKPLQVDAKLSEASQQGLTITAQSDFNRADFGMTWNMLGMIQGLAHLTVVARFVPAP